MMLKENKKTTLRVDPPKVTHVNKTLIIVLGAILFFIFIWAIMIAFNQPVKKSNYATMSTDHNTAPVVNHAVTLLPKSYHEADKIKQYLHTAQPQQPAIAIPPEVQSELTMLRNQQSMLQQQIASMNTKKQQQQTHVTMQTQQAQTSGLFFAGGAPDVSKMTTKTNAVPTNTSSSSNGITSVGKQTPYDQQNMQLQKMQFLKGSSKAEDIYNPHALQKPVSPYEVQAGTILSATLITGLNTSVPGEIVAQIRSNIYDTVSGRYLLIPKGSKLLGQYDSQVAYGQERVLLVFNRIIRPDGSSILLSKFTGADLHGAAGLQGDVNNHWSRILGAATISTLLSFGAGATTDNMSNDNTFYRGSKQSALLGAASNISDIGQNLTNRAINVQPTITLPPGYQFDVIVKKDMVLAPV